MTNAIDALQKFADWQQQHLGRQAMQVAILKWGMAHREALRGAGLADSLIAALDTEIAMHQASRPAKFGEPS